MSRHSRPPIRLLTPLPPPGVEDFAAEMWEEHRRHLGDPARRRILTADPVLQEYLEHPEPALREVARRILDAAAS